MCMNSGLIIERYENEISGVLGCYDRVIIRGTPGLFAYSDGMTSFFYAHNYKIFDFANIFKYVTDNIISNVKSMAEKNGVEVEYVRKTGSFRKILYVRD